jgi:hypothetical protein
VAEKLGERADQRGCKRDPQVSAREREEVLGCAEGFSWWAKCESEARLSFPFFILFSVFFYNYFESSLNLNVSFTFESILQIHTLV